MTVYVKENVGSKTESYYFTDGVNAVTRKDYGFKSMIQHAKFLKSLGITVVCHTVDVEHYINGGK